ncbi:amidohydrolase [Niastella koreensis]|uniref:Amidohydrolase n=2 Tax=Niastella koreensis TaxID=354356 RepID=G8TLI7_NIAKG|nr:amidohydrolase family protein [Niastella koreensis]AEV96556.1 amidohydrolase [Niastella koreensis GR20-10]OQP54071.1 amidohydrolase [Niastella koreensis]
MRKYCFFPPGKIFFLLGLMFILHSTAMAQVTFPVNGVADPKVKCFAFTNATIVKDVQTTLTNATLVIREGKIVSAGTSVTIPKDAVVVNCSGKFIYPSFIDIYSDYGVAVPQRQGAPFDFRAPAQLTSNTKGVFGWNQAIRSEIDAAKLFITDDAKAEPLRSIGFGTVLTHQKDGIARGTGALVTLASEKENLVMLKEKASANYSFSKGTSTQSYPSSMMGTIALLRQTYLDAQWYKSNPAAEGVNLSLKSWNEIQSLPQIFDAGDKWNDLRADRIGDEFGVQYIIKGGGNEYQRIKDIAATKATYIISLNFPQAMDVEDPNEARFVSLGDMKHWELAPGNPAALEKASIPFCLTATELKDTKTFLTNLRKAFEYGLSESKALEALTKTPATVLGVYDKVGSLDAGKVASFLITTGEVFKEKTVILQNWVQGERYNVKDENWSSIMGQYTIQVKSAGNSNSYTLDVKSTTEANIIAKDTIKAKFNYDGKLVTISFATEKKPRAASIRLGGTVNGDVWNGNGVDAEGNTVLWWASFAKAGTPAPDTSRKKPLGMLGKVVYPFDGYGWDSLPQAETILIKNGTVWTNEKEGRLENTDVLIKNGKIAQIGKNLSEPGAKVIDATGKFVTPGIIDEHSHIAAASINEGAQSVTSEVRIADNLNPEDINIYRQLSGGVTSSHILHGSANTIGGQTQLIKLRWGVNDEELKFKGADPFIKFALGENVKRTTSQNNNRFPDTRMGVEEVLMDAFTRACEYEKGCRESAEAAAPKKKGPAVAVTTAPVRRDLELEALVEIMNKKRFITCHSYVQSEITSTMRVAERFNFRVNTFTHILEGYKVADKMKAHGANASTFSDWWAYKTEVQDAIPYNATLMQKVGLNVCINSDDAEMARRLNQEAAKSVKYGGMSEEDAFKMVTLNPAKALHVEEKVGSLKPGKDADVVVWSDNPLSIYAKAEQTIVDGTVYFDRTRDQELRKKIAAEKNRLVQKMLGEKRSGSPVQPATPSYQVILSCGDHDHHDGLITVDVDENDVN